jgi:hypothetical protein
MSMAAAFRGGNDVAAYCRPQVLPPPHEAQPGTTLSGNLRVWNPPSPSGPSWDYLPTLLSTSFSGMAIFRISILWLLTSFGLRRRLPGRCFYKRLEVFKLFLARGLLRRRPRGGIELFSDRVVEGWRRRKMVLKSSGT